MKRFKIALILLFAIAICCCAAACNFTCGGSSNNSNNTNSSSNNNNSNNNSHEVDTDGTFVFSGSSIKAVNTDISGEIVIPSEHNGNTIDTIPGNAFNGCNSITSVVVPNSITSIGKGAFNGCSLLKKITLPFIGNKKGNSGSSSACFGYIFGDSSYQGGTPTRQYYSSINSALYYIPATLKSVTITNETVVSYGAFYNCSMLTKIDLNSGILQVGVSSFYNCSMVEEISLPSITIIPSSLFRGCMSLNKFEINDTVETIGSSAFEGCSALTQINSTNSGEFIIPNSVTSIGEGAFNGCPLLKTITLPFIGNKKGNSGSSSACFGYIFGDSSYQGGTPTRQYYGSNNSALFCIPATLRNVTITNETVVSYGAFYNCSMLTSIKINSAANNNVGAKAFDGAPAPTWI